MPGVVMAVREDRLIERIARGDEAALTVLYEAYYPRLGRFILRVTRDAQLAQEIINDVFLVVWTRAAGFRRESTVSTWILGIAYNKALKAVGRRRLPPEAAVPASAEPPDGPRLDLEASLTRLSPDQRATVELAYFFGYSYREIAEIMHCPENTVKTRMFHARRALRQLLET
jgi:RNA polymerase sigma-70 factor (ECF subfamily)